MPKIIYALFIATAFLGFIFFLLIFFVEFYDWEPDERNQAFIDAIIESANQNDGVANLGEIAPHDFDNICIIYDYMSVKRGLAYSGVRVDRVEPKDYSYSEFHFGIAYVRSKSATAYYISRKLSTYGNVKQGDIHNNITKSCQPNLKLRLSRSKRYKKHSVTAFVEKPKSP